VQDAGCGIATEHLEHIFDPFFTTKTSDNEAELRGLGLTIARWIVRQHDGDITVESTTNVGSTFRISFPVSVHQIAAS
jgi:signal transduction histidine kinase